MPQPPWPDTLNPLTGQGGWVLRLEEWMDIRTLHREGHSIKEIARQTGRSRNTVRRVLREAGPTEFHKPERSSCVDSFKPYPIRGRVAQRLDRIC